MMAHLILDTINKKTNLFGNMKGFTCKYSISSISIVHTSLMVAATQLGSAAEAKPTMPLVKSIAEVTKPLLSANNPHNPDILSLLQSFSFFPTPQS